QAISLNPGGARKLGGGLRPPSEPPPQDAVRAAGRRGAGAPPSEASDPKDRAAGRPRAGPRASEASHPEVAPAKPALEQRPSRRSSPTRDRRPRPTARWPASPARPWPAAP